MGLPNDTAAARPHAGVDEQHAPVPPAQHEGRIAHDVGLIRVRIRGPCPGRPGAASLGSPVLITLSWTGGSSTMVATPATAAIDSRVGRGGVSRSMARWAADQRDGSDADDEDQQRDEKPARSASA
jgi:hypothetical protein